MNRLLGYIFIYSLFEVKRKKTVDSRFRIPFLSDFWSKPLHKKFTEKSRENTKNCFSFIWESISLSREYSRTTWLISDINSYNERVFLNFIPMTQSTSSCECCLMPFSRDPLWDKRENPKYCSYCFSGGELHADKAKDLWEFQAICFDGMRKNGTPWIIAKFFAWTIRFAPYWKERNKKQ